MASLDVQVELDASLVVPLIELIRAQKNLGAALTDLCAAYGIPPTDDVVKFAGELSAAELKACAAVHRLQERASAIAPARGAH
jgi:hypothetical protein